MDTIFAEATPPGRGGVTVVRISGPEARAVLEDLAGRLDQPRLAALRAIRDGDDLIDRALVLWFADGHSFTGEEVAEIHLHGAPVIAQRMASALLSRGIRRAEAGEFTRRAFINGRMDLAEAEGLADLLAAETEAQRKLAIQATNGEVGRQIEKLRSGLIRAGALIEVSIDFADEDVPQDISSEVFEIVENIKSQIAAMLARYPATERLRQGYEVAIIGPPNAGKSTLLNHIAGRDIALVSDVAGTTRDIIELKTDLRGLPVTFLDTAGLRNATDSVEAMGVERARERALAADLRIHLSEDGLAQQPYQDDDIVIRSKIDRSQGDLGVSGLTGEGVAQLLDLVYDRLKVRAANPGLISHRRQAEALERASNLLNSPPDMPAEILAENMRQASYVLGAMIGRIGAEDFLDEIFSSFCIGK